MPERGRGRGLFVVEDLGIDHSGAVVDRAVEIAITVATIAEEVTVVSFAAHTPAATRRNCGQLFHIDVDELTGPFALITLCRGAVGRTITTIEPAATLRVQD